MIEEGGEEKKNSLDKSQKFTNGRRWNAVKIETLGQSVSAGQRKRVCVYETERSTELYWKNSQRYTTRNWCSFPTNIGVIFLVKKKKRGEKYVALEFKSKDIFFFFFQTNCWLNFLN